MQESPGWIQPRLDSLVGKIRWRRDRLLTPVFFGFACGSVGKESSCKVGYLDLIPGLGRSPGEGKSYPLQYSGQENSRDCTVHGVAKSQTQLSDFHFHLSEINHTFSLLHTINTLMRDKVDFFVHNFGKWKDTT